MIEKQWNLTGKHLDLKKVKATNFDKTIQLNDCFYLRTRYTSDGKLNVSASIIEAIAFVKRREFHVNTIQMNVSLLWRMLAEGDKHLNITFYDDSLIHKAYYYFGHRIFICNEIRDNSILVAYADQYNSQPYKVIHIFIDEEVYLDPLIEREIEESNKQFKLEEFHKSEDQVL